MHRFIIAFIVALLLGAVPVQSDESAEALYHDLKILRESFEELIQVELLYRGLTPGNAAVASEYVLDKLAECWTSDRNLPTGSNTETMIVRLGGKAILTYSSPCIHELVERVADLER